MTSQSPLFDRIRVKPEDDRTQRTAGPSCEHPGCSGLGEFRAPKGRGHEGQYWRFCMEHVREYNQSYNYFAGLADTAVQSFQKSALTGHRPTWAMGVNAWRGRRRADDQTNPWAERETIAGIADRFSLFREARKEETPVPRPAYGNAERRAFSTLELEPGASAEHIKVRYKELVKRFHPDANGGDRSREERFRDIVQAYGYLKSRGFC